MKKIHFIIMFLIVLATIQGARAVDVRKDVSVNIKAGLFPSAKEEEYLTIPVTFKNRGDKPLYMKCELGFYAKSQVESWGFALIGPGMENVPNCIKNQDNVDTVSMSLDVGQKKEVKFQIYAPNTDHTRKYVLFSECFDDCYNKLGDKMTIFGYDKVGIDLVDVESIPTESTCKDGIKSGTEVDTDCGGDCPPCGQHQECFYDKDCRTENCQGGICGPCEPDWICNSWSDCKEDGYKYRSCDDRNKCGSSKPPIKEGCGGNGGGNGDNDLILYIGIGVIVVLVIFGILLIKNK